VLGEPIRERLHAMERQELIGLLAIAVLVVAGAGFWYARSLPGRVSVQLAGDPGGRGSATGASPSPSPAVIFVYVTGLVRHPGVYEFHQGDRVIDALRVAGGARPGADLTTVNLAAFLTDAQQVTILKKGAAPAGGVAGLGGAGPGGSGGPVNINTATLEELETLPGIGPALGQRIIDYRTAHGPFRSVDDLMNVSGIGEKRLADLRPSITV
jgi:competence protein ComEA